ncbi:MAG: PAS domain S-box protein [Desulfuromonadales bacterium]|nr:MAG: PAS domain S-box protein [Desulfuromonadales bacterium]
MARAQKIAHLGNWDWDIRNNTLSCSDESFRIYGLSPQERVPTYETFIAAVHPEDREAVTEAIDAALHDRRHYNIEHRLVRPDGTIRCVHGRGEVIRDNTGAPERMIGTVQDITHRKRTEESLRMIRLQQQAMLDNIPDLVWLKDDESRFIAVNAAFGQSCGFLPADLIGKTDLDVWPTDLATLYREDDARVMKSGKQIRTVEPLVDVQGRRTWIETIKMPIFDGSGTVIGTTGIARDITERMQVDNALRESEARFREIFEQNEDAIILLARETLDILDANGAAEALMGYNREELMRLGPWSFIAPDDYGMVIEAIPPAGDTTPFHLDRISAVRIDGTRLIASIWGKIIRLRDTEVVYCSIRDITKKIRMEEEAQITQARLIHANKMTSLGVLVSGIAHEINNPNTFIQGNAALIEDVWFDTIPILDSHRTENGDFILGGLPIGEIERIVPRLLHGVKEGSRRISAIVNNLKDFAREDTAKSYTPISVNRIVEDARLILSYQIHRYTDHFRLDLAENLPLAQGKSQQIEQVVINLIMNALQALPGKGAGVIVSTDADTIASVITITVRDEGEGMSPEVMERLTEPFFSTKLERGGTGLGLSISAAIIREHNGTLKFESTPGRGTTATVTLPIAHRLENEVPASPGG